MVTTNHLKLAVLTTKKVANISDSTVVGNRILYRYYIELCKILAQYFDASYEILTPADHEIGRHLSNGSWTGLIGMLVTGEVDVVVTTIALNEERSLILDFSYPVYKTRLTFLTKNPEYEPDPIVFLRPFSLKLWIFTLFSFIFVVLAFYNMFKCKYSLKIILFDTYGVLLGQSSVIQSYKTSDSFILFNWNIGAMLLGFCYSAVLLSFLTFPPLVGVRTVPELAEAVTKGTYECITYPGSIMVKAMETSTDSNLRIIGRDLQKHKGAWYVEDVLEKTKSSKRQAFIGLETHFMSWTTKYFMSEDELWNIWNVMWMRKEFCCKAHLNRFVSLLWTSGIYKKLTMDEIFIDLMKEELSSGNPSEKQFHRKLSLDDLKGAFVILKAGHIFSLLVLFFEIFCNKLNSCFSAYFIKQNCKKKKRKKKAAHIKLMSK